MKNSRLWIQDSRFPHDVNHTPWGNLESIILNHKSKNVYHNKKFKSINNSENGEVSSETIFEYFQKNEVLWATYQGGSIVRGNIIGKVDEQGMITMRYQHLSNDGTFKTGKCISTPELLPNKKIRLHEKWEWTSGKEGKGKSIIEEI